MLFKRPGKLVTAFLIVSIWFCGSRAFSAADLDFTLGLTAYKKGDYKTASQHFLKAASQDGSDKKLVFLYLGHSFVGAGDLVQARKTYRQLIDKYPNSKESKIAIQSLQLRQQLTSNASSNSTAPTKNGAQQQGLIDRIVIVPPKFRHEPVSYATIEIVKSAARSLSSHIYRMLDKGGATINISPSRTDKWPDAGDIMDGETRTLGEVPGHTYHRDGQGPDIYIFERSTIRGSKNLKEPYSKSEIHRISLHEMGHGVDDLQNLSTDRSFIAVHKIDVADLPVDMKERLAYYTEPMEACAEIVGGLAGHNESANPTELVIKHFPRSTRWLKGKLQL